MISPATPKADADSAGQANQKKGLFPVYLWTLSYVKPYLGLLALVVLSLALVSAVELAIPKFFQYFIDSVIPSNNLSSFYGIVVFFVVLLIVLLAGQAGFNVFQRQLQERASRDLQLSIFKQIRKLGFAYYERNPVGETLAFLNTEVASVQNLYRQGFPALLNGLLFSILSVAVMVSTSVHLSAIVLPSFLLYYLFGPTLEKKASISGKKLADLRVEENRKVYDSVSSLTEVRAFGAESWDSRRYLDKVEEHNRGMIRTYWYAYWRGTNRRLSYYIGSIVIFLYGYYLIGQQSLTVGEFVAFLLYYFTAMHRMTAVVTQITEQRVLMYQAEKLYDFMNLRPRVTEPEHPAELNGMKGELEFRNVYFGYHSERPVLEAFNLTVPQGAKVALVGSSGSGKSTVIKLAGRFYDADQGDVLLDGISVGQLSFDTLRNSFGYVFQETYLFGTSVKENIRFGHPDASDEEVIAAAKAACAHDFIMELPDGYDTYVGERGMKLSGGQKQRIAIARMFIKDPQIILLDEATSALDNASESVVQEALGSLMKGRTLLAVAHRLSTIRDFDLIVVVKDGKVVEQGTYEQLMAGQSYFTGWQKEMSLSREGRALSNFQWMVGWLLRFKGWVFLAVILMAAEMTANLSAVWLQQSIIDDVLINGQRERFPVILAQLACAYLIYSLLFTFGPHVMHHTVARLRKGLAAELMQRIHRLPVKEIHKNRTADLVYRFTHDLGQTSGLIGGDLPRLAQHLAGAVMLVVIIGAASPALLAVVGGFGLVYIVLGKRLAPSRKHAAGQVNKDKANLLVHLEEGVSATREVLAFRREQWEARQYQSLFQTYYHSVMSEAKLINKQMLISDPVKWGAVIIVLLFGGWLVLSGELSLGLYVVLFQFSSRLIDTLYYIYNSIMTLSGKLASVERLRSVLESESVLEGQAALINPVTALQMEGVSFSYEGREHCVLNRITLQVPIGSKTAFVGTSGGGKSTIASLLMRFYEPDEGRILVNGLPLSSILRKEWTKKAAIVFQEPYLFPELIRSNLLLGSAGVSEEAMIETCKAMRIHDFIDGLPERYDTVIGERGITLSGGQRQRLALVRALLYEPELLILDEATSSLDMETEREIQLELDRLRQGKTTIVIAHRLSTIRNADRIYVLDRGEVAEQGTHDELMAGHSLYRRLVLKQRTEEDQEESWNEQSEESA